MYLLYILYYTILADSTPMNKKVVIVGALAYFFLPTDIVPDLLPVIGVADDFGAVLAAISTLMSCSTPEIKEKAKLKSKSEE